MNPTQSIGSYKGTNILQGNDAYVRQQVDAINQGVAPKTNPTTTFDASRLQSSTGLLAVAPAPITTTALGLTGMAQGVFESDSMAQEQEQKIAKGAEQKKSDRNALGNTMREILQLQVERPEAEKSAGIPQMTMDVNNANQRFLQSQFAETNELRALETKQGMSPEGKQQAQQAIQRRYAFENADNALSLSLARQDLSTAQSILDKKYELELEPLQQVLEYQKFFYSENADELSKAEDREFQLMLTESERRYETQKNELKQIGDLALSSGANGAPSAVVTQISNAKTYQEAIKLASPYMRDELETKIKEQQLRNLQAVGREGADGDTTVATPLELSQAEQSINTVSTLGSHPGFNNAVGPGFKLLSRVGTPFTGSKADFIAEVEQLTSNLTLESLIQAKARGATFGALSDREMVILSSSATKIGSWRKIKDEKVVGYVANEKDFKRELDIINNFAKLDFVLKGGDPASVGIKQMADGTLWTLNSDGSYTQLR